MCGDDVEWWCCCVMHGCFGGVMRCSFLAIRSVMVCCGLHAVWRIVSRVLSILCPACCVRYAVG